MNPNFNWSHVPSRGVSVQGEDGLCPGGMPLSGRPPRVRLRAGGTHPTGMFACYRPQRSCGKVMFLHLSVILFTGGPPPPADGHCSGRYASFWNAFLSFQIVLLCRDRRKDRYLQRCICLLYSDMLSGRMLRRNLM